MPYQNMMDVEINYYAIDCETVITQSLASTKMGYFDWEPKK